jgi:hypothetical protein
MIMRQQVYPIPDRDLLYWRVDLTRGINTLRHCKWNLCCIQQVFNWSWEPIIERAVLKEWRLLDESQCNKLVDSVRIFCLVISTSCSKVSADNQLAYSVPNTSNIYYKMRYNIANYWVRQVGCLHNPCAHCLHDLVTLFAYIFITIFC